MGHHHKERNMVFFTLFSELPEIPVSESPRFHSLSIYYVLWVRDSTFTC